MPVVTMPPVLIISDFSPAQDHQQGGGTKVLVCLENEIPEGFRQHTINVSALYLHLDFCLCSTNYISLFLALLTTNITFLTSDFLYFGHLDLLR